MQKAHEPASGRRALDPEALQADVKAQVPGKSQERPRHHATLPSLTRLFALSLDQVHMLRKTVDTNGEAALRMQELLTWASDRQVLGEPQYQALLKEMSRRFM